MRIIFIGLITIMPALLLGQVAKKSVGFESKILWLTLEEAKAKSEIAPRKILLFLYTDWCFWCKKMEETTFLDNSVVDYINRKYYPVKFNAEEQQTVKFNDRLYEYQEAKPHGVHGLAIELMGGHITYPTISFLDKNWVLIQSIPNYKKRDDFLKIINYFGEDYFRTIPWATYLKNQLETKSPVVIPAINPKN